MRRLNLIFLMMAILLGLAACGPSPEAPIEDEAETGTAAPTRVAPTATALPATEAPATATPDAYPVQPTVLPAPDGYPAAPPTSAPPTAYPADMRISVLRPLGAQCTDADTYTYASLEEAVLGLENAGVEVFSSETVNLTVCEACNCPTSEHFRVEILRSDLGPAQTLGWYQES